jgi:hypothetical protein
VVLVSIIDAAYFTKIPAGTIRRWVSKERITRYGDKPCKVDMLEVEKRAAEIRDQERRAA